VHVAIESPQPGIMVVRPQGTLDMHSVPAFHPILEAAVQRAERGLIVALADITCMDSAGLAVLIEGLKWSRGRALPYVLTQVPPAVQRVLELARLEHVFPIAPSVEEAERHCTRPVHAAPPAPPAPAPLGRGRAAPRAAGGDSESVVNEWAAMCFSSRHGSWVQVFPTRSIYGAVINSISLLKTN